MDGQQQKNEKLEQEKTRGKDFHIIHIIHT